MFGVQGILFGEWGLISLQESRDLAVKVTRQIGPKKDVVFWILSTLILCKARTVGIFNTDNV